MSIPLLVEQLCATLAHLDRQSTTVYSPADRQALRTALSSTIKILHELYPDGLNVDERQQFLETLVPLEHQFLNVTLATPAAIPSATWQQVHRSLQANIKTALQLFA